MAVFQAFLQAVIQALYPVYFKNLKPYLAGVVYLGLARQQLFEHRMVDYNAPDLSMYPLPCTDHDVRFRTYDGHCNSLELTNMGAANTRFSTNALKDPQIPDLGLFEPEPFRVAELLKRTGKQKKASSLNLLVAGWIQFNVHDWFNHTSNYDKVYKLRVGPNQFHELPATAIDEKGHTRNQATHWWDLSQVYGQDKAAARRMRVKGADHGRQCELALDKDGLLPLDPATKVPGTPFNHNWWVGMELFHTLFAKEHNALCGMLRGNNPSWPEDDLFETARLINAALCAKIHTTEWTPALLQNELLNISLHNNWYGLSGADVMVEEDIFNTYRAQRPNFLKLPFLEGLERGVRAKLLDTLDNAIVALPGHANVKGVGHWTYMAGTPYSFSEDFVSAYRIHSLLPDKIPFGKESVGLTDLLFDRARPTIKKYGLTAIFKAFAETYVTNLELFNYPRFRRRPDFGQDALTRLKLPWMAKGDYINLGAIEVFRDRERGMPRYNQARRSYNLQPAATFEDITSDRKVVEALKDVYHSVEDVDYLIGVMAEEPRPPGYAISDTSFRIFLMHASRRLLCDRFYQENFHAASYTEAGLQWIKDTLTQQMFERHFPDLAAQIPPGVTNMFLPWRGPDGGPFIDDIPVDESVLRSHSAYSDHEEL